MYLVDNGNASGRYGNLYIYIVIIYIYSNYIYIVIYIYCNYVYIWYFNGKFFDDMRKFTKKIHIIISYIGWIKPAFGGFYG